jgi:CRP/FNR family cyclic AMP-dependent transcriptional regulator
MAIAATTQTGMDIDLNRTSSEAIRVSLLSVDPSLASAISPEHTDLARRALSVEVTDLKPGPWDYSEAAAERFGYLIGEGFLIRQVRLMRSRSVEPLGPGDLLRPWEEEAVSFATADFNVLTPVRLAVLDRELMRRAGHFPGLLDGLAERAIRRARYLAVYGAIDGLVGVHRRLIALMWTLAERWGTFREGAVFLPVELQHSDLAGLIAARRPSVSSALGRLQREGQIERVPGGWLLKGQPPELEDDRASRSAVVS